MYFNSLFNGLSLLPEKSIIERNFIDNLLTKYSCNELHFCLKNIDPPSYKNIDKNDMQRIQRALEVYMQTGKPITSFFNSNLKLSDEYDLLTLKLISKDRSLIHEKISMRTKNMFKNNLIDEVTYLIEKYSLTKENQSMRSIGYRQVMDYFDNNTSLQDLENRCVYATRQLAKRQITWLKKFDESIIIDIANNNSDNVEKAIDNHLHS
jgi:tRNA dimethylallyltransferase